MEKIIVCTPTRNGFWELEALSKMWELEILAVKNRKNLVIRVYECPEEGTTLSSKSGVYTHECYETITSSGWVECPYRTLSGTEALQKILELGY